MVHFPNHRSRSSHGTAANAISSRQRNTTEQRGGMMGRMMAFIVVVVCTAQVVLLRAQERTRSACARHLQPALRVSQDRRRISAPRPALRRGRDLPSQCQRLDLHARRRGTHCARERDRTIAARQCALEERVARTRPGAAAADRRATTPAPPPSEAAPPRPPAPIPAPQADAGEHRQAESIASSLRWSAGGAASSSWSPRSSMISRARIEAKD